MPTISRTFLLAACGCLLAGASMAQPVRYVAFGDSITEGLAYDGNCTQDCGYPRRLEEQLRGAGFDAVVDNRGLGGERTPEGLTRLDGVLEDGGDVLLLMEGTNDISRGIGRETTLFNLGEMARKAAEQGLDTVHATLIPRFPEANVDASNVRNASLCRGIRSLAAGEERNLVDPFEVMSSVPGLFEVYYASKEDQPNDPVGHPNPAGYDLLTGLFFDVLTGVDKVAPVLGSVEPPAGSEDLSPLARIRFELLDFASGVDTEATRVLVSGVEVPFAAAGDPVALEITHLPEVPLANPVVVEVDAVDLAVPANVARREVTRFTVGDTVPEPCVPSETVLCIDHLPGDRRFRVHMSWQTASSGGLSGEGLVTSLTEVDLGSGGLLSYFPGNPEMLIKILDGCDFNDRFWVFGAATTNVGFQVTVEDTIAAAQGAEPGETSFEAVNVDGENAVPFFDTDAFATCGFAAEGGASLVGPPPR